MKTFFMLLARSSVNSPHKGQWRRALMFSFDLRLNKRLSKQSWGWWFDTSSRQSRRHYIVNLMTPWHGNTFPITVHFEDTSHRCTSLINAKRSCFFVFVCMNAILNKLFRCRWVWDPLAFMWCIAVMKWSHIKWPLQNKIWYRYADHVWGHRDQIAPIKWIKSRKTIRPVNDKVSWQGRMSTVTNLAIYSVSIVLQYMG